ncbi:hypothetical protein K1719_046012 [Acacia pycnantha]|nr:hypothetical protein K1719_046012 [Acacia pycnantha]
MLSLGIKDMGEDTHRGFTSHLYQALISSGFRVFRDDEELRKGDSISHELLQAIVESHCAIVILSENYASSSWCLDELQHIYSCLKKQSSFAKLLEEKFQKDQSKVQNWRNSLTEVANLSGFDSRHQYRQETELIDAVAQELGTKLHSRLPPYFEDLIGIDDKVEQLEPLLKIGLNDVRFVGLWGLAGVGKTTIARAVFEKYCSQFDISCFLPNVRATSLERDGEKAFGSGEPQGNLLEMSKTVCCYAKGLPLALSVLGSFFGGMSSLEEWKDALDKLKKHQPDEILRVLQLSFDALDEPEKAIFLDIACFFNGWSKKISLLTMLENAVDCGLRKIEIQGMVSSTSCEASWDPEAFSTFRNLRLLIVTSDFNLPYGLQHLSHALKVLHWTKYPLDTLPPETQLDELVDLKMRHSKLKKLWNKSLCSKNLKFLDLSYSKNLIETPDICELPNLERLELKGCTDIVALHASIGQHTKLRVLNLKGCKKLKNWCLKNWK